MRWVFYLLLLILMAYSSVTKFYTLDLQFLFFWQFVSFRVISRTDPPSMSGITQLWSNERITTHHRVFSETDRSWIHKSLLLEKSRTIKPFLLSHSMVLQYNVMPDFFKNFPRHLVHFRFLHFTSNKLKLHPATSFFPWWFEHSQILQKSGTLSNFPKFRR